MYFYLDCLQKQGKFGLLWMAAFECTDFNKRNIQFMVKRCIIERSCDDILKYTIEGRENSPKMNLYVTSNLLAGVVKILKQKAVLTLRDSAHLFIKWGEIARSLSSRDVKERRIGREEDPEALAASRMGIYLHGHHHAESPVQLFMSEDVEKQKELLRLTEEQVQSSILEATELAEKLRAADGDAMESHFVPQDITMKEVPPIREEIPDEGFGGVGLEDLAPFVQEALVGVQPVVEERQISLDEPIVPEVMETVDIPGPVVENDITVTKDQPEPEIAITKAPPVEDANEIDIEQVLAEMLTDVSPTERRKVAVREGPDRKARDTNLAYTFDRIKEKCTNFQNLMRHTDPRKDTIRIQEKKTTTIDWIISDELKIASCLLPHFKWPPARPKYTIEFTGLQPRILEAPDESMEVQKIRQGGQMDEMSMHLRPFLDYPTPTILQREGHVRATPSPSPIGKGIQKSFTELNLGDILEQIPETAVIDSSSLLQMSMEQAQEPQEKEKSEKISEKEIRPLPPKRQRLDADSESHSSLETSICLENLEDKMKSLISEVLKRKETVTFNDIAPPSSTSKRTAACLFSTLLDLEKKRVLVTQQDEPYGIINIQLAPTAP